MLCICHITPSKIIKSMLHIKNPAVRKRVAVFFGGRSPEHDVSVVTGLQILGAIDPAQYEAFPVYITPDGAWLTGDVLRKRENYMLDTNGRKKAMEVTLDVTAGKTGRLVSKKTDCSAL